jgi:hypothetical protein
MHDNRYAPPTAHVEDPPSQDLHDTPGRVARRAGWVLLGAGATSLGISVADYAQGMVLSDWSGMHPITRLNAFPFRFGFATAVACAVAALGLLLRLPPLHDRTKLFGLGAACGCVTVGSLLAPWISREQEFSWFVFASVAILCAGLRVVLYARRRTIP